MVPRMKDRMSEADGIQRLSPADAYFARAAARHTPSVVPETEGQFVDLGRNYKDLADTIAKAANTISELVKRNQTLRAEAEAILASARAEAELERERANKLQADLDGAMADRSRLLQEHDRRVRELNADKQNIADRLEKTTADLDLANQWLDYLNSHVQSQLGDAMKKAEVMFRNRSAA